MNVNTVFCRMVLKGTHERVKKFRPDIKLKDAWVWSGRDGCWEFHGPEKFYWYGRAYNAYEARAKGWMAWLTKEGAAE